MTDDALSPQRTINVRPITQEDSPHLWRIRNLDVVRALSNNPDPIPREQHDNWFSKYYQDPDNHCMVIEVDNVVAGYCRIDHGLISIALDPNYHGLGLGTRLLQETINRVSPAVAKITAEIRRENEISLKLFTKVGFNVIQSTPEKNILEYSRA